MTNKPATATSVVKRSQFDQNLHDLDSIVVRRFPLSITYIYIVSLALLAYVRLQVEDDKELLRPRKSSFFSFGNKPSSGSKEADIEMANERPEAIEGWLDKKGKGKASSEWQKK